MQIPSYLKKGDKVAIVATARKVIFNEIHAAKLLLEEWGFEVVLGANLTKADNQFAGDDYARLKDLQTAIDDASIKAILTARGGYGTVRIIDDLDLRNFSKQPKWICGFSDITVLHSHIHALYEIPTIHSPMAINMGDTAEETKLSNNTLLNALLGRKLTYPTQAHDLNREGNVTATLVGGNLSLLHSLSGTDSDIDTTDKILFIEDVEEYLYHLDRMMMQLKRSGKLENLAGLVVGAMNKMNDNAIPFGKGPYEIIAEHVAEYDFPVCYQFPAGHIPLNVAMRMGLPANLLVDIEGGILTQGSQIAI
jgi:muramoyltetrapeptide carboxypeptidase